jgi:glycosyltransferase involved in cell wall biosynthesis
MFWKLLLLAERLSFKLADVSIATNESYRRIAIERGGMRPDRVFVVRSGPDIGRVKSYPQDSTWRHDRKYLIGYLGVISQSEGLDLLLQSIEHIVREKGRNDIQFVLVGGGPEWQAIKDLCEKMNLQDYVTLPGRVDDKTLFTILSTADVCVNPDRVTTMNDISTMNKIMEYMALEKPIVQFDVTEGRFSAGEASLYAKANDPVDFADKILELLADPEARSRMGQFGHRRVHDELAWHHEQPKLLAAYDKLFEVCRKETAR